MLNSSDLKIALGAALLALLAPLAHARPVLHLPWEQLSEISGETVRIALPEGVIQGKASHVEDDALVVDVKKTSDRHAYPKGMVRVPREKLQTFQLQTRGKKYRIIMTALGAWLGIGGGATVAYFGVEGCEFFGGCRHPNPVAAGFAFAGIAGGTIAGGYYAGKSLDTSWTTVVIQK